MQRPGKTEKGGDTKPDTMGIGRIADQYFFLFWLSEQGMSQNHMDMKVPGRWN